MMQGNDGFSREEIELAQKEGVRLRALRAAFPHTIPIMAAFLFVGVTYGMLVNDLMCMLIIMD